jgi:hypothetical protein
MNETMNKLLKSPAMILGAGIVAGALLHSVTKMIDQGKDVDGWTMFNVHDHDEVTLNTRRRGPFVGLESEWDYVMLTDCPVERLKELVRETFLDMRRPKVGTTEEAVKARLALAGYDCIKMSRRIPDELTFDRGDIMGMNDD